MLDNANMSGNQAGESQIYDALMAIRPAGLSNSKWAERAGIHRSIFNGIKAHGNPTSDTIQKLLDAIGASLSDLYERMPVQSEVRATGMTAHETRRAWSMPDAKPVPLVGTAFGTDVEGLEGVETIDLHLSEVLDYVGRPPSLANDPEAYAITVVGDSMAPRYEPGEMAFVSPRAAVHINDDVIAQLTDPAEDDSSQLAGRVTKVILKRLVKRTSKMVSFEQFNPPMTFEVPVERVRHIHKVRGRL